MKVFGKNSQCNVIFYFFWNTSCILGIDFFRRSFAAVAETSEIISKDGDAWNLFGQIHIKFPVKVISEIKFKEEEEFEYG